LLDLGVDAQQPSLRARGTIAEMRGLGLGFAHPPFGRPQLKRELVRQVHGARAILLGHVGRLLQQAEDAATGVVGYDVGLRLPLRCRSKRYNRRRFVAVDAHHYSPLYRSAADAGCERTNSSTVAGRPAAKVSAAWTKFGRLWPRGHSRRELRAEYPVR